MKRRIIECLKESGGYVSGQDLCERLGVSRTAVWKAVNQLRADGYEIEAVRNRGYRLMQGNDVYNQDEIAEELRTSWAGRNLIFFDETDSTNIQLRLLAEKGVPEGTLVVAGQQNAGKGRRGRAWLGPRDSGVWMSLLLRPGFAPEHASMLTLVAALAVAQGIREQTGLDCGIKWPNDIVLGGKKVCGILTEMSTEMESIHYVIIGIGINVGIRQFPEELRDTATSLSLETGKETSRAALIGAVMRAWEGYYARFLEKCDLSTLNEEYSSLLVNKDREVRVLAASGEYTGICRGIDDGGELLVEMADKSVRRVISGEVSVRGIYGYV
ncbi:MAG: biotin--[acetyl-CoA-carboxylase] ligase [Clostridiales bacterium]|nr:biotin--[acetyl-CoA-carboxylase] ligase [Clostridiales bacterium]